MTDLFSRHIQVCEGFGRISTEDAIQSFSLAFEHFGLPRVIRSDNGAPFASRGLFGISRLSAFFISLGIRVERIQPGKPQQNGSHERMHRTLKAETIRPAASNLLQQQERFDHWVKLFNTRRPHEALDNQRPADVYVLSETPYKPAKLEYALHDDVRTVNKDGSIQLYRRRTGRVFLSTALSGYPVGLRELETGDWLISFGQLDLGIVPLKSNQLQGFDLKESKEKQNN